MIRRFPDLLERTLAGVVLLSGVAVSFWLQWDAARLDRRVNERGAQLDHLRTMAAPRCVSHLARSSVGARPSSTTALAGVFPGHRVVWLDTPAGPVLGVEPSRRAP